ncbi:MAG: hypothetical protein AVW06_01310 [Hadesarchaea archaeon DG-33-1]|nr:MAG: hypothetical protein AVW06_01310 [Hadesarchaea archaeon DG-33-1]
MINLPKKKEPISKKVAKLKRELEVLERELNHLIEIQWVYAKRMLKFGVAAWVFGLSLFFSAIIISDVTLLSKTPAISISLIILAAAAPIFITAALIRKFAGKIRRLERVRRMMLTKYEKAILKRAGEILMRVE